MWQCSGSLFTANLTFSELLFAVLPSAFTTCKYSRNIKINQFSLKIGSDSTNNSQQSLSWDDDQCTSLLVVPKKEVGYTEIQHFGHKTEPQQTL